MELDAASSYMQIQQWQAKFIIPAQIPIEESKGKIPAPWSNSLHNFNVIFSTKVFTN